jgi:hypothetical protein
LRNFGLEFGTALFFPEPVQRTTHAHGLACGSCERHATFLVSYFGIGTILGCVYDIGRYVDENSASSAACFIANILLSAILQHHSGIC